MKTKLLFVIFKMNLGGTERALLSLLDSLKNNKNIEITLLLLEEGGQLFHEIPNWVNVEIFKEFEFIKPVIFDPPLKLIKNDLRSFNFFDAYKNTIRYLKVKMTGYWHLNYKEGLKRVLRTYNADVAIAFAGPHDFITYFIATKVIAKRKIQWIHFDVREVINNRNFGNKYYKYFDNIYCVSENAKLVFDEMFPKYSMKTKVFKNIVSKKELENLASKGDSFSDDFDGVKILTLGRLSKEKGQLLIPIIVHKLKSENLKFRWYLIGDGNLNGELKLRIEELGIADSLILLGGKVNPYRFLQDCDIYVQTSFHEGYCLTIHEAKIFNKPVVTTNVVSASNLIVNNKDGLIVEISEEGVYKGVKTLLTNNELRLLFGRNLLCEETVSEIEKLNI
jgi:glycosyltransferase involved in cell wall biosynthesis